MQRITTRHIKEWKSKIHEINFMYTKSTLGSRIRGGGRGVLISGGRGGGVVESFLKKISGGDVSWGTKNSNVQEQSRQISSVSTCGFS